MLFPHQGVSSPQWDGSFWGQTDPHGASLGSTHAPTCQCPSRQSFPWSRWVLQVYIQTTQAHLYEEHLTTHLFLSLFLSWIRLLALRAHGNSCPATGAHSQAKYSQVVCAEQHQHLTKTLHLHISLHHILLDKSEKFHLIALTSSLLHKCL